MPRLRWLLCLAVVAGMAGYVGVSPLVAPREPFADGRWKVDAVMVLNANTTTIHKLCPPYCVIRNGDATFRGEDNAAGTTAIRVDLEIDGEHVVMFSRQRQ